MRRRSTSRAVKVAIARAVAMSPFCAGWFDVVMRSGVHDGVLTANLDVSCFALILTRPVLEPLYRTVVIPGLGAFRLMFGPWYTGLSG